MKRLEYDRIQLMRENNINEEEKERCCHHRLPKDATISHDSLQIKAKKPLHMKSEAEVVIGF